MKNIITNVIFIFSVIMAAAAAYVSYKPANEISVILNNAEVVISWNIAGMPAAADIHHITRTEKYFSIEKYDGGDINDSFYIGTLHNVYDGPAGRYDWHVFRLEGYKNVDQVWLNIEIGI